MANRSLRFRSLMLAVLVALPNISTAQDPGAYLAARQAGVANDFDTAADYYIRALKSDPTNAVLLENAIVSLIGAGDFETAKPLAETIADGSNVSDVSNIVVVVEAANDRRWDDIQALLEAGLTVSPLIDGALQAWGALDQGRPDDAFATLDEMISDRTLGIFGAYQKALALAYVGDFEGAEAIFADPANASILPFDQAVLARAQILGQLGRADEAVDLLRTVQAANNNPQFAALAEALASGEPVPFDRIASPSDGVAEIFLTIAIILADEGNPALPLVYARSAQRLNPDNVAAILMTADLLEQLGRHEMATQTYALVPQDDPSFVVAEFGRATALKASGKTDAAIEVLQQLIRRDPTNSMATATLGDYLRGEENFKEAEAAYTTTLDLYGDTHPATWWVLFARGITRERLGQWDGAEADFRKSLDLNPGQPSVLNYLGYSLLERREKLDEALAMIEEAVALQPESGAIVDSLGWALYRLGRVEEAVPVLEKAASLEATDPVVNDHLGDVLWLVGRKSEARFQWQRAMSFGPAEVDATRIRRKLDVGLDVVLEEEGATPLTDNGNN